MFYVGAAAYVLAPGAAIGAGLNVVANGATINSLLWPTITSLAGGVAGLLMTPGIGGPAKYDTQTVALKIAVGAAIGPYVLTQDMATSAYFALGVAGYYYYYNSTSTPTPTTTA